MKKQIIFIHGGNTFATKKDYLKSLQFSKLDPYKNKKYWIDYLILKLQKKYEIITPKMPCKENAKYEDWKIWFEKYFSFIKDKNPILVGHSLGSIFLLKYLSENDFPKKINQLHLVAPAVLDDKLDLEKLSGFKPNIKKINKIEKKCDEIHIWYSKDDDVCIFKNSEIIKKIIPSSILHTFKDRGHFNQPLFPEILEVIKKAK